MQPGHHPSHGVAYQPSGVSQYIMQDTQEGMEWRQAEPVPLTKAEAGLQIARPSRPWRMYGRVVGLVVLAYFFTQLVASGLIIGLEGSPYFGALCIGISLPFMLGLVAMRRPRIILLERALPDPGGQYIHPIASHAGSLRTPMPTRMGRHLIRDDSVLDVPSSGRSWLLFTFVVLCALGLGILTALSPAFYVIALPLIIPTILVGFSIPVMAWWSHSTKRIGLPTRRRDAEAWLMAGILCGIPAILINSWIFPNIVLGFLPNISDDGLFFAMIAISAPVGEEICKGLAVFYFADRIRSPRHGFQVGFTVGLGFAIVENLQYIVESSGGGIGFSLTMLVRGIGSIPGHAFWTGLTGVGMGWMLMRNRAAALHRAAVAGQRIAPPKAEETDWKLFDTKTGLEIDPTGKAPQGSVSVSPSGVRIWTPAPITDPAKAWFRLPLPKHPLVGLMFAILGHGIWNGSSVGIELWALANGLDILGQILLSLVWTGFLVLMVLLIGSGLLGGVREAPDGSELEAYRSNLATLTSQSSE